MSNMDWAANGLVVPADKGFKSINYGNAYVECMERSWDGKFSMKVVASALETLAEAKEAYAYKLLKSLEIIYYLKVITALQLQKRGMG